MGIFKAKLVSTTYGKTGKDHVHIDFTTKIVFIYADKLLDAFKKIDSYIESLGEELILRELEQVYDEDTTVNVI